MSKKTVYIAGPMAGYPHDNIEAFDAAESKLRREGWEVVNPLDFAAAFGDAPEGKLLDACCAAEIAAIPFLDAIYLLKGWKDSKGAKRELLVALQHDLVVLVEGEEP